MVADLREWHYATEDEARAAKAQDPESVIDGISCSDIMGGNGRAESEESPSCATREAKRDGFPKSDACQVMYASNGP